MEAIEVVSLEPIFKRSLGMDVVFNASVTRDCATIVYGNSEFMYGYEYGTGCPSPHSDYFFTTNITGKLKVFIQKLESER